jgi:putative phosphoribosyl transferase
MITATSFEVKIPTEAATLDGTLTVPHGAPILVLFAHGSGSSRFSPRNLFVAHSLNDAGIGTLLFDLLTRQEEALDARTGRLRFDIGLLAKRLGDATDWISREEGLNELAVGYFGASTGAGAALVAAAGRPAQITAVVSRGGRPDLANGALPQVTAPTLLIVGSEDHLAAELNEDARERMRCEVRIEIIPGATHLFEEPGALDEVARLASDWFRSHAGPREPSQME